MHVIEGSRFKAAIQKSAAVVDDMGKACGLTESDAAAINRRIQLRAHELVAHIQDEENACNPHRLVFLAMVNLRSEKRAWYWYAPWRAWRIQRIINRFADMWSNMDDQVGVAQLIP